MKKINIYFIEYNLYKLEIAVMGSYKRRIKKRPRHWYEVLKTFAKISLLLILFL